MSKLSIEEMRRRAGEATEQAARATELAVEVTLEAVEHSEAALTKMRLESEGECAGDGSNIEGLHRKAVIAHYAAATYAGHTAAAAAHNRAIVAYKAVEVAEKVEQADLATKNKPDDEDWIVTVATKIEISRDITGTKASREDVLNIAAEELRGMKPQDFEFVIQ